MKSKVKYRLGKWSFEPELGRFTGMPGVEFFIEQRLNKLLTVLLHREGLILTREDLLDMVWDDTVVSEENLTKGVFDLRKLLEYRNIDELEIETIRNVGYRLIIREKEKSGNRVIKHMLKGLIYLFLGLLFLIMLIRAINY